MSGLLIRFGVRDLDDAVAAMADQDDRSMVIVASSILEDRLVSAIKSKIPNTDKEIEGQFWKSYGPLASFRSRIDLAFFMRLYNRDVYSRLARVKEIRNRMAHRIKPHTMKTQEIKDQMQYLPNVEVIVKKWEKTASDFKSSARGSKDEIDENIDQDIFKKATESLKAFGADERGRFLCYIQNRCLSLICAEGVKDTCFDFFYAPHLQVYLRQNIPEALKTRIKVRINESPHLHHLRRDHNLLFPFCYRAGLSRHRWCLDSGLLRG